MILLHLYHLESYKYQETTLLMLSFKLNQI